MSALITGQLPNENKIISVKWLGQIFCLITGKLPNEAEIYSVNS